MDFPPPPFPPSQTSARRSIPLEIRSSFHPPWLQTKCKRRDLAQSASCDAGFLSNPVLLYPHASQDRKTLLELIKSCANQKDLQKAKKIHGDILRNDWFPGDVYVGTAVLSMYAKCGALTEAQMVFDDLSFRSVVSWNALISGYAQHGCANEALDCYSKMISEGFPPNAITFASVLKACGMAKSYTIGEDVHADIKKLGLLRDNVVLGNALVDMYAKCGLLEKAQETFEELPLHDVVSWSILVSAYVQLGFGGKALTLFRQMKDEGVSPNKITFIGILKACGSTKSLEVGEEIHAEIRNHGLLEGDSILGNTLMDMYGKCGALGKAREVFEELRSRDVVSWNVLISGYVQQGLGDEALNCFQWMRDEGISPNAITFVWILKACSSIGSFVMGEEIHAEINKQGLLEKDILVGTTLVDTYAKCGLLAKAKEVFDKLPVHDVVSWSALIAGYVQHGISEAALECFKQMKDEGISPNMVTFLCILKACGKIGSLKMGEEIHNEIKKRGLLNKYSVLGNALVDMYAKCGALRKAEKVFRMLPIRDVISWTALIYGYTQHGFDEDALECFNQMRDQGVSPNVVTYICILKACGHVGYFKMGEKTHAEINEQGLFDKYIVLGNTLIDMYSKFGMLQKAHEVFDGLAGRDIVSWNALIAGYAELGLSKRALYLFREMETENIVPDLITFLLLLTACSHCGLTIEGQKIFDAIEAVYHLSPTLEHCSCLIDICSRAGHFDKAITLIETVPSHDRLPLWLTLLGACHKWITVELGEWAFKQSVQLDENCHAAYVCMGNIYAAAGKWDEAEKMGSLRLPYEEWEKPAIRWTSVSGNARSLTAGEKIFIDEYAECGVNDAVML